MVTESDRTFLRTVLEDHVGLSPYEVNVYLALLNRGRQTMAELSMASDVPKQRVYDTVEALEKRELAETTDGRPTEAFPVEPGEVISPVREQLKQAEESLNDLYQGIDDIDGGVRLLTTETTNRSYLNRIVSDVETNLQLLIPIDAIDRLESVVLPRGVRIQLLVAGLDEERLSSDCFGLDNSLVDSVDELRGIARDEPFVAVADSRYSFARLDYGGVEPTDEPWGYYLTNPSFVFMIDRYVACRWREGTKPPNASNSSPPSFPKSYIRMRDCLSDIQRATRNKPIESLRVEFEGYNVRTGEPIEGEGSLLDYHYTEYNAPGDLKIELDEPSEYGEKNIRIGGWKTTCENYEARRITVRDKTTGPLQPGLDSATREHLEMCRESLPESFGDNSIFVGFDGYVDQMREIVDTRQQNASYSRVSQFETFKKRFLESGTTAQSPAFDWVETTRKPGGHSAHAGRVFRQLGYDLRLLGSFGRPPVREFREAFPDAELVSVWDTSTTDYITFETGKLMLNDRKNLINLDWQTIQERVGLETLTRLLDGNKIATLGDWGSIPNIPSILENVLKTVWPRLEDPPEQVLLMFGAVQRLSTEYLPSSITALDEFDSTVPVTLIATRDQAVQYGRLFDEEPTNSIPRIAETVHAKLGISQFVVHTPYEAVLVTDDETLTIQGHRQQLTHQSGNAEDHFAAGYAIGQIEGLRKGPSLVLGNAVASYHNQFGATPTPHALREYLQKYDVDDE